MYFGNGSTPPDRGYTHHRGNKSCGSTGQSRDAGLNKPSYINKHGKARALAASLYNAPCQTTADNVSTNLGDNSSRNSSMESSLELSSIAPRSRAMESEGGEHIIPNLERVHISGQSMRQRLPRDYQLPEEPCHGSEDLTRADLVKQQQQAYLLKVCRAFMMYGAPTHRLEEYMRMTAEVLGLHLQSFYVPGCMIISYNDPDWHSSDVRIVRCAEALNLAKLDDVHLIYRDVIHKRISIAEAIAHIDNIVTQAETFPVWVRVLMYGLASACIGPVSYGARPIDLPFTFLLGCLLGYMELVLAKKSELYAHVLEMSAAIMISFFARAFGSIRTGSESYFCFSAICQGSLVLILPGFTITSSALELQSRNIVSGSVRIVYGVIYTLFLAFGVTVGSAIYGAMDSGATSASKCTTSWPFWWQVIFVVPFAFCYITVNQGRWKNTPPMLVLTLTGWLVNHFSTSNLAPDTQIAQTLGQTLGALTVGVLANLYSRFGYGLAVALLHPAIFIQVPGSLAAAGSLISGIQSADQLTGRSNGQYQTSNGTGKSTAQQPNNLILGAGYSMIEIAIGITVGLSVSALLVYPVRKKTGKSGLFSF